MTSTEIRAVTTGDQRPEIEAMNTDKPLSRTYLNEKMADALRADRAKRAFAKERGLDPVTLKPASGITAINLPDR